MASEIQACSEQSLLPIKRDPYPYKQTTIHEQGLEFTSFVDPFYVADLNTNRAWYKENQDEVLLNLNYPSKKEKVFLKHIELWQQAKNDARYRRILHQLETSHEEESTSKRLDLNRYNSLTAAQRGLVVQEDAQCAICNNGDYEDEDLIVFCDVCNIPVHQKCYGIDELPDKGWVCNNCKLFEMQRGVMVKCILCPKRGGAMKPTSIFRRAEHYQFYHNAAAKKKGL